MYSRDAARRAETYLRDVLSGHSKGDPEKIAAAEALIRLGLYEDHLKRLEDIAQKR